MEAGTVTPPIEDELRRRIGGSPPEDFGPEPPDVEPQDLPETDEEEDAYVVTLELFTHGLSQVDAVKKAHELLQSADSKGLRLIRFNVADFEVTEHALDVISERG